MADDGRTGGGALIQSRLGRDDQRFALDTEFADAVKASGAGLELVQDQRSAGDPARRFGGLDEDRETGALWTTKRNRKSRLLTTEQTSA